MLQLREHKQKPIGLKMGLRVLGFNEQAEIVNAPEVEAKKVLFSIVDAWSASGCQCVKLAN